MKVKVASIYYDVEIEKDLCDVEGVRVNGCLNTDTCVIGIDAGMGEEKTRVELWHEILHTLELHFDISMTERVIARLARGIAMVLGDNPVLRQ